MIPYAAIFGYSPSRGALAVATIGEGWHDFYLMAGTAAVTLVGLLFVALSIHVEVLFQKEHADFRELAAEAFQGYLYVLITALIFLLPASDGHFLAIIYVLVNLAMLVRTGFRAPRFIAAHAAKGGPLSKRWRILVPVIAYLLGIVAVLQWWTGV